MHTPVDVYEFRAGPQTTDPDRVIFALLDTPAGALQNQMDLKPSRFFRSSLSGDSGLPACKGKGGRLRF